MIKKIFFSVVLVGSFVFAQPCFAVDLPPELPQDFHILAISGGRNPHDPMYQIEIQADGTGIYSEMPQENRASGLFIEKNRFQLKRFELAYLFKRIRENEFFNLEPLYERKGYDGTFALIEVAAHGRTHRVETRNIGIPAFDSIALAINIVTPEENDLVYNEILTS